MCHRATAGDWIRGVLEQYVAGSDTRGRPEARSYPWSQQAIHEISGLVVVTLAEVSRGRRRDIKFIMRDVNPAANARAFFGTTLCLGGTDNFNQ
jgi:hypothetical protein